MSSAQSGIHLEEMVTRMTGGQKRALTALCLALFALIVWAYWREANWRDRTTPTPESRLPGSSVTREPPIASPQASVPQPAKTPTAEQKRAWEKAEALRKQEREKEQQQARISAAQFFENKLLAAGYSADVFTNGPRNTHLTLRYIQFTEAFQYQFEQQEQGTLRSWRELGFTKVTMTDGYGTNSVWEFKR